MRPNFALHPKLLQLSCYRLHDPPPSLYLVYIISWSLLHVIKSLVKCAIILCAEEESEEGTGTGESTDEDADDDDEEMI